ncbi:MAG: arsenite methyltransferase [Bacteroidetes bacterium]|nr:arsenite methyltransferase [Bacteroidota bacterium]
MKTKKDIKDIVREKYGKIADNSMKNKSCCGCSSLPEDESTYTVFSDEYHDLEGYNPDADLSLGCGLPTEYAGIKEGDTVLDLGSGAGNDCFVARALVGEQGKVIGLDFTPSMVSKAKMNNYKLGFQNIEFITGDIEHIPLPDHSVDVVISNCVLNLVPDKAKAFSEIYRVLKQGAHFCVSDIVLNGVMPDALKEDAILWAGCVSGAVQKDEYLRIVSDAGFRDIDIPKEKKIDLPDEMLKKYLSAEKISELRQKVSGIYSITVRAHKS